MTEGQQQAFHWKFKLKSSPLRLWPYLSDTNKIFQQLGATPVKQTSLSRSTPKGVLELSHNNLKSYVVWEEEPFLWEKPYRFGVVRHYKLGMMKDLRLQVDLNPTLPGAEVEVKLWVSPSNKIFTLLLSLYIEHIIKRKLQRTLTTIDHNLSAGKQPYESASPKKLVRGANRRLASITEELIEQTKRKRIVNRLVDYLRKAEDVDLRNIHPYTLAEYWGEKKYSVLNVFLYAAKLNLLDFGWNICCPSCKAPKFHFRKLKECHLDLYCDYCDQEYKPDFNRNMHLVFKPHPLIRKLSDRQYCIGGPGSKPHRVSQHFMNLGEDKYLKVKLEEGSYRFRSHNHEGYLNITVREDGADNVTLYLTDEDFKGQEVLLSSKPNLVISNRSSKKCLCYMDKVNWKQEAIYASEVSSSLDFRNLFSRETLKENDKVQASEVTMLFTDLMNSTELYIQEGDESAIGRVMSHFKIIQQIVAEERGGIVKTIGDSVMAVFREPVSALKAVQRIQQIFTTSTSMGDAFKIKAGVHFGDCTAVNLNGRIDYFGTTVNIASRLVDAANEKEIMVSEAVYNHPDVRLYLEKNEKTFFIKESQKELKGFEDEEFKVKQIRLERPSMRLVI